MYYLLIECCEREFIVTPCGFNKEDANMRLCEAFLQANEHFLEEDDIEKLMKGIYPKFEEDVADIGDGYSWSNMDSSHNYDSILYELNDFSPIVTYEDAREILKSSVAFRKSEDLLKDPDMSESAKKIIPGLCEMRDGIEKVLRLIEAGKEIPLEDIHFIQNGFVDFNSAL